MGAKPQLFCCGRVKWAMQTSNPEPHPTPTPTPNSTPKLTPLLPLPLTPTLTLGRSAMQNSWMYPKTEDELRGWNLHRVAVGAVHTAVHLTLSLSLTRTRTRTRTPAQA